MKKKILLTALSLMAVLILSLPVLPRFFTPPAVTSVMEEIATLPAPEGRVLEDVVYKRTFPGKRYSLDIYYPTGKSIRNQAGPSDAAPVLVFIHGGSWLHGDKSMIRLVDPFLEQIRENGIALVAVDYTAGITGGLKRPVENCRDALGWIAANGEEYGLDPEKIGLYGVSAGAHLAMMTIPEIQKLEGARLLFLLEEFGPVDLKAMAEGDAFDSSGVFRLFPENTLDYYSPINYVDQEWPPVLMLHGTADRTVAIHQTELLAARFDEVGVPYTFKVIPEGDHGFFNKPQSYWRELENLCMDFILPLVYPGTDSNTPQEIL